MTRPRSWSLSLEPYGKGIDNTRVDCRIGTAFRDHTVATLHRLIREDAGDPARPGSGQLVTPEDLAVFRDGYLGLFESALERHPGNVPAREALVLLQLALLKLMLQGAAREGQALLGELKSRAEAADDPAADPAEYPDALDRLVVGARRASALQRRVLQLLFRQIRTLESGPLRNLRVSAIGRHWPVRETILFNPLLLLPDPAEERALVVDYPIAWLDEAGVGDWLALTEQTIAETFEEYLPARPHETPEAAARRGASGSGYPVPERRDQGELRGFLAAEILLERFVPRGEYRSGAVTWLDEPANLGLLLPGHTGTQGADAVPGVGWGPDGAPVRDLSLLRSGAAAPALAPTAAWDSLREEFAERLRAGLESAGLAFSMEIVYALPALRAQLGLPLPLGAVLDYADGRGGRRRLEQRLGGPRGAGDGAAAGRAIDRILLSRKRQDPRSQAGLGDALLARYLTDFLILRRDLKLAYKTFELLDGIRLLESEDDARLSRANASLHEFLCRGEHGPSERRIRAHAVVKADLRGSTLITEELRARGLNPASHFSLNFFNPVNVLLPEYGAEKLFVEGDAVIMGLYEHHDEGAGFAVARACRLARQILRVVTLQNIKNRQHDLPELELGLGIAFSRREPNFLYDEGRRIMISSAINQADRLSSCSGLLRRSGFEPANRAFRVAVVRDALTGERAGAGRDLLTYNVNGVKLDDGAVYKLQQELPLTQVQLPDFDAADGIFYVGGYTDGDGRTHWLALRQAPVLDWYGDAMGPEEPEGRHYYELVVDEQLMPKLRRLAE